MKSGKLQKKANNRSLLLKMYFIFGSVVLFIIFIIFTNVVVNNVRKDIEIVPDIYSKFVGMPTDVNLEHFLFQYFMEEILPEIDYPIILADSLKIPFSWENIDIPKDKFDQLSLQHQNNLLRMVNRMEAKRSMLPLRINKDDEKIYGYVYYGDNQTMRQLKMMPYAGMAFLFLFSFLGMYGIYAIKKTERDILWVGLAKETAHQFGTPLSSLGGWIDVLNYKTNSRVQQQSGLSYPVLRLRSSVLNRQSGGVELILLYCLCKTSNESKACDDIE